MAISLDDLARIRTTINGFLVDSATNSRTGLTSPCWVHMDTREIHLLGMSSDVRLRRWRIMFPDGTDMRPGDVLTVPGKGTYTVLEVAVPVTNQVQCEVFAAQQARADGSWPIITNYTVKIQRKNDTGAISGSVTLAVLIEPNAYDEKKAPPDGRLYQWKVCFPLSATIGGHRIEAGDEIVWTDLRKGFASLHRPAYYSSVIPYGCAYFLEIE